MRVVVAGLALGVVAVVGAVAARPATPAATLLERAQMLRRQADAQLVAAEAACRQKMAVEPCRSAARAAWLAAIDQAQQLKAQARQHLRGQQ